MPETQLTLFQLPPVEENYQHLFRLLPYPLWTEHKAKMIAAYLRLFVFVTKHGTYIDGFAGPQQPDMHDMWTAKLVLDSNPSRLNPRHAGLNQFYLCELAKAKWPAVDALVTEHQHAKRPIVFHKGDFNKEFSKIVAAGTIKEKTATFCLLDQHTFECEWRTVEAISRAKPGHKIELFYFVPTGWLKRSIAAVKDKSIVQRWWGREDWETLKKMPEQACANEFCNRFQKELGYKFAHAWPIYAKKDGRKVMYFMVHATDHIEAPKLMNRAYRAATGQAKEEQLRLDLPAM